MFGRPSSFTLEQSRGSGGGFRPACRGLVLFTLGLAWLATPSCINGQIRITLKNSFIEKYKNRTSIGVTFTVDKAHARANAPSKDGDLHIAGRAPEVRLPIVAEIMNAGQHADWVQTIHDAEGTGNPLHMSGAWRIWCEHGGLSDQVQGKTLRAFSTTNPEHVFEIHPVTSIEGVDYTGSLVPIEGYEPKTAEEAFTSYEDKRSRITVNGAKRTTTIETAMAGMNYVEFVMKLTGPPWQVPDGSLVMVEVHDLEGELLIHNRRMVLPKGSAAEIALRTATVGDEFHVLGMPRINLAILSWRTRNRTSRPEVLTWNLPYEIIIVGWYPSSQ
jgi:hypothetical protein